MKIASLVATGFAYYLNNRRYRQISAPLPVSSMKILEEKESTTCVSDDCSCDHNHDDTSSSPNGTTKALVAGSEIAFVNKLDELARIMEDDIQLVVWEQLEQPSFIKVITLTHHVCYFFPLTLCSNL